MRQSLSYGSQRSPPFSSASGTSLSPHTKKRKYLSSRKVKAFSLKFGLAVPRRRVPRDNIRLKNILVWDYVLFKCFLKSAGRSRRKKRSLGRKTEGRGRRGTPGPSAGEGHKATGRSPTGLRAGPGRRVCLLRRARRRPKTGRGNGLARGLVAAPVPSGATSRLARGNACRGP